MFSGVHLVLGLRTRWYDPCLIVVFRPVTTVYWMEQHVCLALSSMAKLLAILAGEADSHLQTAFPLRLWPLLKGVLVWGTTVDQCLFGFSRSPCPRCRRLRCSGGKATGRKQTPGTALVRRAGMHSKPYRHADCPYTAVIMVQIVLRVFLCNSYGGRPLNPYLRSGDRLLQGPLGKLQAHIQEWLFPKQLFLYV